MTSLNPCRAQCPRGHYLVPVSESDAGRGFFRQSLYVDPEDDCRLWELEPVSSWEAVILLLTLLPSQLLTAIASDLVSALVTICVGTYKSVP